MPSGVYTHKEGYKRPYLGDEWRSNLSKSLKGRAVWNAGKKLGPNPEHSKRMKGRTPWNKGKIGSCPHTKEWREMMSIKMRGENGSNWQGGITLLNFKIRNSFRYRQWRSDVFGRDAYVCQGCGATKCWIEAHHKKMFSVILKENDIRSVEDALLCEELWDIDNGVTLCEECHDEENRKQMTGNKNAIKNGLAIASVKTFNGLA
jgi:hypothetical protein